MLHNVVAAMVPLARAQRQQALIQGLTVLNLCRYTKYLACHVEGPPRRTTSAIVPIDSLLRVGALKEDRERPRVVAVLGGFTSTGRG